ncbi:MAG: SRPBCC family protein [Devosia sp.]|nr:SRPBCC family protein [Devosia sp.]
MSEPESKRNVTHATFVIERVFPHAPSRVFHALADEKAKRKWFHGPDEWGPGRHEMDFRIGGREVSIGGPKGGPVHSFNAVYQDIVPDRRIVFSYDMMLDDRRISVSLTTIELRPEGAGTRMLFTEQGAYLDGYDDAGAREHGTRELVEQLGRSLLD